MAMNETDLKPIGIPQIVVVGSINMDLLALVRKRPGPGETVSGLEFEENPGGKGANQAVAAARLGASSVMVGCVGNDAIGQRLRDSLRENQVDISNVRTATKKSISSGVALITVDSSGENTIVVVPGANGDISPADVAAAEATLRSADAILVQLEIPLESVAAVFNVARRHGVRLILDPAPARDDLPDDMLDVDVLCPNSVEAQQLTGMAINSLADAESALRQLARRAVRLPIITLGAQGAIFVDDGEIHHVEGFAVDAVDATAAGDSFAGALAVALVEGQGNHAAVRFACAAGAIAASRRGAQQSMPSRQDVDSLSLESNRRSPPFG
jgi:ribokinase